MTGSNFCATEEVCYASGPFLFCHTFVGFALKIVDFELMPVWIMYSCQFHKLLRYVIYCFSLSHFCCLVPFVIFQLIKKSVFLLFDHSPYLKI
jgi:hypothetical protein